MKLYIAIALFSFVSAHAWAAPQTLEQSLAQAYASNPSLQAAQARLRAVDEQVSLAKSRHWRPAVNMTSSAGMSRQRTTETNPLLPSNADLSPRNMAIEASMPLFRGFQTEGEIETAKSQMLAERELLHNTEQKIFLATALTYLDILRDEAISQLYANQENILSRQLEETKDRFQAGAQTQTDVSQAEARLEHARANRLRSEGALSNDKAAFIRYVGLEPGVLETPDLALPAETTKQEILQQAISNHPTILAAQHTQKSAEADITTKKGALLPKIDLVGRASRGWEQDSLSRGRTDSSEIMVRLTVPLYEGGADYSRSRSASQTATQRRLELEAVRREAYENALNAWQDLQTARAAKTATESEIRATSLALEGVRDGAMAGTQTTLDVLNAEQEVLSAQVDLIRAKHDEMASVLRIKEATGTLTAQAMRLPVAKYDAEKHYNDVKDKWAGFD